MGRHRKPTPPRTARVRYDRLALLVTSASVTGVALLAGTGIIGGADGDPASAEIAATSSSITAGRAGGSAESGGSGDTQRQDSPSLSEAAMPTQTPTLAPVDDTTLPAGSGAGRRVVFDQVRQRVWLVGGQGLVRRTYPVSGSVTDNLKPGTYEVYSRSEQAQGIDDSGTMRWMVRFAHGRRAAIGFHDIPRLNGRRVQALSELGTARSHGCIRQRRVDAKALWDFAPLGTRVVVTG